MDLKPESIENRFRGRALPMSMLGDAGAASRVDEIFSGERYFQAKVNLKNGRGHFPTSIPCRLDYQPLFGTGARAPPPKEEVFFRGGT